MTNDKEPGPSGIVDEANVMMASIERVKTLPVKVIYPGHGKPFSLDELAS
jgi:glyoxylase-like metal-dependent hydrolase (beta-lactamase superfamily II)